MFLNSLEFFKSKEGLLNHIKKENLNQIKTKNNSDNSIIQNLKKLITEYLLGKKIELYKEIQNLNIDLNLPEKFRTSFSQKVINKLLEVAYGYTTNYSEIAESISSKAYRAVGNVIRKNPLPLIIPCHRVIKKNGELGGFMGFSDGNTRWQQNLKKDLLKMERSIGL